MHEQVITPNQSSSFRDSISKSQLAEKLGVSRNTLLKFHRDYGLEYITDYYESFPRSSDRILDSLPLSPYQAWVLSRLINQYLKVPSILIQIELSKEEVLEGFDFQSFSRLQYLNR